MPTAAQIANRAAAAARQAARRDARTARVQANLNAAAARQAARLAGRQAVINARLARQAQREADRLAALAERTGKAVDRAAAARARQAAVLAIKQSRIDSRAAIVHANEADREYRNAQNIAAKEAHQAARIARNAEPIPSLPPVPGPVDATTAQPQYPGGIPAGAIDFDGGEAPLPVPYRSVYGSQNTDEAYAEEVPWGSASNPWESGELPAQFPGTEPQGVPGPGGWATPYGDPYGGAQFEDVSDTGDEEIGAEWGTDDLSGALGLLGDDAAPGDTSSPGVFSVATDYWSGKLRVAVAKFMQIVGDFLQTPATVNDGLAKADAGIAAAQAAGLSDVADQLTRAKQDLMDKAADYDSLRSKVETTEAAIRKVGGTVSSDQLGQFDPVTLGIGAVVALVVATAGACYLYTRYINEKHDEIDKIVRGVLKPEQIPGGSSASLFGDMFGGLSSAMSKGLLFVAIGAALYYGWKKHARA